MHRSEQTMLWFLARHCAAGVLLGLVLVGAILALDVAHLGTLVFSGSHTIVALALLIAGFGVTFGSLAMGTAIFLLPYDDPDAGAKKKATIALPSGQPSLRRVPVIAGRR
ncbi:MAG: hypothetical protein ACFB3T_02795 [Geminicoccaceae bacterium]